ncbi:hypothetical protein KYB31_07055 [Clostridium felsineum]|uniref:hypothetical protein n=1 Tax=Clostridium felsineum TaxID=36839 RepID=UPI00214D6DEA|nr:hypothetical protein [Clostridium felsineum]MCR3758751.1 hypothetical protein [Clostridium felsineum]
MKKKILIALLAVIMIVIVIILASNTISKSNSSTKKSKQTSKIVKNKAEAKSKKKTSTNYATPPNTENSNNTVTNNTSKSNYTDKNVAINYPKVTSSNNQNSVNALIKDQALKVLNFYPTSQNKLDLKVDYNIKWQGTNLLSIVYTGIAYNQGAPHQNNLFFTTNINLNNLNKVKITDAINVDANFITKLKQLNPEFADKLKAYSTDELLKEFNNSDSLDNIGTDKQSDIYSYFTKDALFISIPVSTAEGDHKEFQFNYKDIKSSIKTDNPIWKDFNIN